MAEWWQADEEVEWWRADPESAPPPVAAPRGTTASPVVPADRPAPAFIAAPIPAASGDLFTQARQARQSALAGGALTSAQRTAIAEVPRTAAEVTYAEWSRMSRTDRRAMGLPETVIGGQMFFNRMFGGPNDAAIAQREADLGQRLPEPPLLMSTAVGLAAGAERGLLDLRSFIPAMQAQAALGRVENADTGPNSQAGRLAQADLIADRRAALAAQLPEMLQNDPVRAEAVRGELAQMLDLEQGIRAAAASPEQADIQSRLDARADEAATDFADAAIEMRRLSDQARAIPYSPRAASVTRRLAAAPDTVMGTLDALAADPLGTAIFLGEVAAESTPQLAAGAAAALITRSPGLAAVLLGAGGYSQEYGVSVNNFLLDRGVELRTMEDAAALLRNPEVMREADQYGMTRGIVIMAAEMLGQGAATAATRTMRAVPAAVTGVGAQAATGGGGEALAQLATGEELSAREIIIEAMAETLTAPIEIGMAMVNNNDRYLTDEDRASPIPNDVIASGRAELDRILSNAPPPPNAGVAPITRPAPMMPDAEPAPPNRAPVGLGPAPVPDAPPVPVTAPAAPIVDAAPDQPAAPAAAAAQPVAPSPAIAALDATRPAAPVSPVPDAVPDVGAAPGLGGLDPARFTVMEAIDDTGPTGEMVVFDRQTGDLLTAEEAARFVPAAPVPVTQEAPADVAQPADGIDRVAGDPGAAPVGGVVAEGSPQGEAMAPVEREAAQPRPAPVAVDLDGLDDADAVGQQPAGVAPRIDPDDAALAGAVARRDSDVAALSPESRAVYEGARNIPGTIRGVPDAPAARSVFLRGAMDALAQRPGTRRPPGPTLASIYDKGLAWATVETRRQTTTQTTTQATISDGPRRPVRTFLDHAATLAVQSDPATFQYKSGGDQDGVTDALRGVRNFDAAKANKAVLFERLDGTRVVADGHQRFGLARRAAAAGQADVGGMPVEIYREADGYTARDVMILAAEKNIAEGSGTPVDAARVMRLTGKSAAEMDLPPQSALVRDADGLRRLSDAAFGMVANGVASERDGAAVGRVVADPAVQADILALLTRISPPNAAQAEMIARQASEDTVTETQTDMFGELQVARSLYAERAAILDAAMRRLKKDVATFRVLVNRGETISAAGNRLDQTANRTQVETDASALAYLSAQANRKGPISDALRTAAEALAGGVQQSSAVGRFVEFVRGEMGGDASARAATGEGRQADAADRGQVDSGRPAVAAEGTAGQDLLAPQARIPDTDREQTGKAQADAAEIAARQQQSRIGRLDQTRVEDDTGGLFGEPERDLFAQAPPASWVNHPIPFAPSLNMATAREALPRLRKALDDMGLSFIGLGLDRPGQRRQGAFVANRFGAMDILIGQSVDPEKTLYHETIHALRHVGAFRGKEWDALTARAEAEWMEKYDIAARYPALLPDEQASEAIAEAFADFAAGKVRPEGLVRVIADRIAKIMRAIRTAFGPARPEDIFAGTFAGEIMARNAGNTGYFRDVQAIREQAQPSPARGPGSLMDAAHIPDRRVWEELTAANATFAERIDGGADAAIDALDKARFHIQDRMLPLLRAQEAVTRATGEPLPESMNAYLVEETFSGKAGMHMDDIEREFTLPIIDIITGNKGLTIAIVGEFLTARHAKERNARIAKINKAMPDGGSGMESAKSDAVMTAATSGPHAAALAEIGALVDRLRERTIALRVDAGLMTEADAATYRAMYRHYVPLKGFAETEGSDASLDVTGIGRRYSIRGAESKAAMGRRSAAFNPLVAALTQAQEVAIRAEKNRVARAVYDLAEAYPSENLWEVKGVTEQRYINKTTGMVGTMAVAATFTPLAPNEMSVKVDGVEKRIVLHDERLVASLGAVGADQVHPLISAARVFTQFQSMMITMLNPQFLVVNAFRDIQAALINVGAMPDVARGKIQKDMILNWRKALVGAFGGQQGKLDTVWQKHYREFVEAGAKVSFFQMDDPQAAMTDLNRRINLARGPVAVRALKVMLSPRAILSARDNPAIGLIERANLSVDNAVRLAAFVSARETGMSVQSAASLAKNLTVNFNKRGAQGPWLNALYLFFNAAVQGLTVTIKALGTKRGAKIALGMTAAGVLLDLVNAALSEEDEDEELAYDKIPDFVTRMSLPIMIGGDAVTIPMPYVYALFPYMGQQIGKLIRGVKSPGDALADVAVASLQQMAPIPLAEGFNALMPTFTQLPMELATNTNWMGRNIRPEDPYADFGPDAYKYYAGVTSLSRWVANALNRGTGGTIAESGIIDVSPEYIDHTVAFLFGGLGAFVGRSADSIGQVVQGTIPEMRDIPIARVLRYNTGEFLDRDRYYRFRTEVRAAAEAMDTATEAGEPLSLSARRLAGLESVLRETENRLREIRSRRREVQAAVLTDARRATLLDNMAAEEAELHMRFNTQFLRIMGSQAE